MIIYFMLLAGVLGIGNTYDKKKNQYNIGGLSFFFICIPLWLIMGFRYNIGMDYLSYKEIFEDIAEGKFSLYWHIETAYRILNLIISKIFNHYVVLFLVTGFVIVFFHLKTIFENSKSIYLSLLVYICLGYYFNAMNGIRQFIAISFCFYALKYMEKKCFLKYCMWVLLAACFHKSAMVCIPVYFAVTFLKNKYFYVLSGTAFAAIFIANQMILNYLGEVDFFRKFVTFSTSSPRLSFFNIALATGILIASIFVYKRLKVKKANIIMIKHVWIILLVFLCLYQWGVAATRIAFYFTPVYILLIPEIIYSFPKVQDRRLLTFVSTMICCIYMIYMLLESRLTGNNFYPYISVFTK